MIVTTITNLLQELSNYHRTRSDALYDAISKRLDKSLYSYAEELDDSFNYLKNRKPDKLMRKINR